MKAEDLMIGDWVYDTILKCNTKVELLSMSGIRGECNENVWDEKTFDPIPLTAEILGKNKFSKSRLMGEQRHFTYYLAPSVSLLAIYDADFSLIIGDCARYIKYVHQLQHVLRLCRVEKEIIL